MTAVSTAPLGQFIATHREEIVTRCLKKIARESVEQVESQFGIPAFLTQLIEELEHGGSKTPDIRVAAAQQGSDLFLQGFTASEVVHTYGSVCQAVTDLAVELHASVAATDFRTMNRCLDDAIAGAVSEYTRQTKIKRDDRAVEDNMAMINIIHAAITAFEAIQSGTVGVGGSTGVVLRRCLDELMVASTRRA